MIETERRRRRRGAALRSLRRSHNGLPVSCSGNPVNNRVVFGFEVSTRLLIGSSSCRTRLYIRVGRVDTNPTRMHKLPSLPIFIPGM
jgi:hypothetical protein